MKSKKINKCKKIPKEANLELCVDGYNWEQDCCVKCPYYKEDKECISCILEDIIQE